MYTKKIIFTATTVPFLGKLCHAPETHIDD